MKRRSAHLSAFIVIFSVFSLSCSATGWLARPEVEPLAPPTPAHSKSSPVAAPSHPALPSPQVEETSSVQVFLVALEDNGASGPAVGCGDSLVPVNYEIESTNTPLRPALDKLLSLHEQFLGQSGLYNALYQSDLRVDRVRVENGKAVVELSGKLLSGGVCDDPRIIGQLKATALQFGAVQDVRFLVNGQLLEEILAGK